MKYAWSWTFILMMSLSSQSNALEIGQHAPTLLLSEKSDVVNLDKQKGKVVFLDFWASWCEPCRKSFPWMNEMQAKYESQGLQVIAINLDTEKNLATHFLETVPAHFLIGYDANGDTPSLYGVKGMPTSFIIDRTGNIIHQHLGFKHNDTEALEQMIQHTLDQQP